MLTFVNNKFLLEPLAYIYKEKLRNLYTCMKVLSKWIQFFSKIPCLIILKPQNYFFGNWGVSLSQGCRILKSEYMRSIRVRIKAVSFKTLLWSVPLYNKWVWIYWNGNVADDYNHNGLWPLAYLIICLLFGYSINIIILWLYKQSDSQWKSKAGVQKQ